LALFFFAAVLDLRLASRGPKSAGREAEIGAAVPARPAGGGLP
jgi:hypothetical protein